MWKGPRTVTHGVDVRDGDGFRHAVTHVRDLPHFLTLRDEWDALAARSHGHSGCLAFPYCELAATRLFADGGTVAVIRVHDDDGLCALWPLGIRRVALIRVATVLTSGTNEEYGDPLVRDGVGAEVFAHFARAAAAIKADVLRARFVERDSGFGQMLARLPMSWLLPVVPPGLRDDVPDYLIDFHEFATWEDFAATRSKSMFADSRRHLKRLNARGQAEFGWCKTVDDAEQVLTWLFAHKRQWATQRRFHTKFLMHDDARDFFIELARRTDLATTPLVTWLRLDGAVVAASVNLIGPRWFEGIVTTFDEGLRDCAPGNLMHEFCMRWAQGNQRDFDFRVIFSAYKARWATRITTRSTMTVFLTLRGRVAELELLRNYALRLLGRFRGALASRAARRSAGDEHVDRGRSRVRKADDASRPNVEQ